MKTELFNYDLPSELIAQRPADVRSESRLLLVDRCRPDFIDSRFSSIGEYLRHGDCLVLNDTRVLPARFYAARKSGASLEGLFLKENPAGIWHVMLKGARKVKTGEIIILKGPQNDELEAEVIEKNDAGLCLLKVHSVLAPETLLNSIGFAPLPPYIKRKGDPEVDMIDRQRYQTVYARSAGAVAAPTAGLHFTDELMDSLKKSGVMFANVTLHVGAGTFKPVTAEDIDEHEIHEELYFLDGENADVINQAKSNGGRIIAVGTTAVRTLETTADNSSVNPGTGQTRLFIKPGYQFKIVNAMVTNFHLPKSTLLALVSAFAGLDKTMAAYRHAVEMRYRFYSYGDAMLIL
ncbi:MAG: tRNA preQ1(34) S-adenosylmethionine ribosyltransferase-isomerase QueA [Candidatus Brocadiia bacterium]|nr:MAG: tRNA preQ1(34) S-adenosylmethionine ribosyltransferase-isomerase QueA [Candidatus Brocadiia bacterium]